MPNVRPDADNGYAQYRNAQSASATIETTDASERCTGSRSSTVRTYSTTFPVMENRIPIMRRSMAHDAKRVTTPA